MEPLDFEDYEPGFRLRTMARTVTETDLVSFVGLSGMYESLFIDQEASRASGMYSGRLVPGALVYAISEGLIVLTGILHGRGLAFLGVDLSMRAPVHVGDTIHVEVELASKRETRHPDRGIVVTRHRVVNQRGETVVECDVKRMIRRRVGHEV